MSSALLDRRSRGTLPGHFRAVAKDILFLHRPSSALDILLGRMHQLSTQPWVSLS